VAKEYSLLDGDHLLYWQGARTPRAKGIRRNFIGIPDGVNAAQTERFLRDKGPLGIEALIQR
jgi:hypothetical protein